MWSQLLGKAGYETYCTGKWHIKIDPKMFAKPKDEITAKLSFGVGDWIKK